MNRSASDPGQSPRASGLSALGSGAGSLLSALSLAPDRVGRLFRHRFPTVAVTGMTGAGKSRLIDRISRHSAQEAQADVGSATMERRTRKMARGRGFRFRVVPGDNAATRLWALDEVFHDEPVDGVLHVVSYGHATPRRPAGTTGAASASHDEQLAAELEDWAITAHRIAGMAVRRDKPVWLVIAVTKTDLYPDRVEEAVRYYSPGSGSPFSARLDELRGLAGGARIAIDVLPASVPAEAVPAARHTSERQIAALERRMSQLAGHL